MEKKILYKYAEDTEGKIIHVDNAVSGVDYFCPECKGIFIFKNGSIRQHHFAHNHSSTNCSGEGYLHKTFKKILVEKIREHIDKNMPLDINWKCNVCNNFHNYNLVNEIYDVKDEYVMERCRPDIVLIDKNRNIPIIIEVIVTHEPENNVIEYCKEHNAVLVKIKLDTLKDLENIVQKIKCPTNVLIFNEPPQGKPCGINKIFRCLIRLT
jgi:hypothetical protein